MTTDNNHSDREHALIAPSAMHRIMKCPASVLMSKDIKQKPSPYAEEGTLAHQLAEAYLKRELYNEEHEPIATVLKDEKITYDADMHIHGNNYANFICRLCRAFKPYESFIEHKVEFSENVWGTADFLAYRIQDNAKFDILIVDYKYGQGYAVDPEDNAQLKTYAIAASKEIQKQLTDRRGFVYTINKVYAYVYQPRIPGKEHSRAVYTDEDLFDWKCIVTKTEKIVSRDINKTNISNYLNAEGLEHCRFCPAKSSCKAFAKESNKGLLTVMEDRKSVAPDISKLTLKEKITIFEKKKAIEHFLEDVEHDLFMQLSDGKKVPGYKLVEGRSQRQWLDEKTAASGLIKLGVANPYKQSLIGIGEAEKLIEGSKKEVEKKLESITKKTTPKKQIAPEDDKRPAINMFDSTDLLTPMKDKKNETNRKSR